MLEVLVMFIVMSLVALIVFLPLGYFLYSVPNKVNDHQASSATASGETLATMLAQRLPEDSTLKRHFLAQLEAEVKSAIAGQPSDATLRRHYEALVAAEVEKRLATLV